MLLAQTTVVSTCPETTVFILTWHIRKCVIQGGTSVHKKWEGHKKKCELVSEMEAWSGTMKAL